MFPHQRLGHLRFWGIILSDLVVGRESNPNTPLLVPTEPSLV